MQRQAELFTQAGVHHPTVLTQQESFSPVRMASPGKSILAPLAFLAVGQLSFAFS